MQALGSRLGIGGASGAVKDMKVNKKLPMVKYKKPITATKMKPIVAQPMNGKRMNNFGGKNPQTQGLMGTEYKRRKLQPTVSGKSINNFGGKNPQI